MGPLILTCLILSFSSSVLISSSVGSSWISSSGEVGLSGWSVRSLVSLGGEVFVSSPSYPVVSVAMLPTKRACKSNKM